MASQRVLLALLSALLTCRVAWCQCVSYQGEGLELPHESGLKCGHVCPGERGLGVLPVLWAPLRVQINCSSSSFTVLTAHNSKDLVSRGEVAAVRWCGWHNILVDPRVCHVSLSPLHDQFLAVEPGDGGVGLFTPASSGFTCEVDSSRDVSTLHIALTVLGLLLFFNAPSLSMSTAFRLSSGTLMFVSGAVVVLSFVMMRNVPYRRAMFAFFTVSTSSLLAAVRWVYGTWLPDWQSLVFSRPFLVYVVVTSLAGLAVTYWLDDAGNVKLNTTIRVTLQLAGLSMIYGGLADERVAAAAVLVVVFHRLLAAVGRWTWRISRWSLGRVLWLLRGLHRAATAVGRWGSPQQQQADGYEEDSEFDSDDEGPLLSDEEDVPAAGNSRRRQQQQQQPLRRRAQQAAGRGLDKLPSLDSWVPGGSRQQQQQQSPLHLRTPPPRSPFVDDYQHMMEEREERELSVLPQQLRSSDAAPSSSTGRGFVTAAGTGDTAGGYRFPSTTRQPAAAVAQQQQQQQHGTPWSNEKVAVDLSRRRPPSASPAPPSPAPSAAAAAAGAAEGGGQVSPLVARGKILNPESGRAIQLDGSRYLALLQQGFTPDFANGVLLPPPAAAGAGSSAAAAGTPTRRRPSSRQGH